MQPVQFYLLNINFKENLEENSAFIDPCCKFTNLLHCIEKTKRNINLGVISINNPDFNKSLQPGKFTCCENGFACLVLPLRGELSLIREV